MDAKRHVSLRPNFYDPVTTVSQRPYIVPGDESALHEAKMKVVKDNLRDEYVDYKVRVHVCAHATYTLKQS